VVFFSSSRIEMPWPTRPATTSLTPWVPLSTVRLAPASPRAAASTSAGRFSISVLAAISSWLPSRSDAASAWLASACPWASERAACARASARSLVALASDSAIVACR
jgi:hypothetical protein